MKRLSEVSKITGLSRRALQGYHDVGLLSPSATTEAGYWLYSDEAIRKLLVIKTFAEGGYTRERMKEFFASPAADVLSECDELIESLEEERRTIAGKIRTIRLFKIESGLSSAAREALAGIDAAEAFGRQSFASCFDAFSKGLARLYGEVDAQNVEAYFAFWCTLAVVGLRARQQGESAVLNAAIDEAFDKFCLLMRAVGGGGDFVDVSSRTLRPLFPDFVRDFLSDEQSALPLENLCGEGSCELVVRHVEQWGRAL